MNERVAMTAAMLVLALGVAATIKATNPPVTAAVAQPFAVSQVRPVPTEKAETMAINPSPVIDHDAPTFVGTGDGSNGDWIKR
jgi:hypothetical protein